MTHLLRTFTLLACLPAVSVSAADGEPPFTREVQGKWHVLTAHCGNQNIATGSRVGSLVSIAADGLTWNDPEDAKPQHVDSPPSGQGVATHRTARSRPLVMTTFFRDCSAELRLGWD